MTYAKMKLAGLEFSNTVKKEKLDMTHEQIEYCGGCEHYVECPALSKNGQLATCQYEAAGQIKAAKRGASFSNIACGILLLSAVAAFCWLCTIASGYNWE